MSDVILDQIRRLENQGRLKEALMTLEAELKQIHGNVDCVEAFHLMGRLQHRLGLLKEAARNYQKALDLAPDRLSTLNNLAALLISSHSLDSAREVLDAGWAAQRKSSDQQSWELLMNTDLQWHLHRQQFEEAHQLAHQLVVAAPSSRSLANLSIALRWIGRPWEAMRASSRALDLLHAGDLERTVLELNLGTMQLACNPMDPQGWRLLNARLMKGLSQSETQHMLDNLWQGSPCEELCLWDEQGFGDTLMALRWLPAALKRCGQATLMVRRSLLRLLEARLDLPDNCRLVALESTGLPPWRFASTHAPLMSLPGLLPQGDVASAPSGSYMKRSKEAERRHACGVVWAAGGKQDAEAERMRLTRSLPAESVKQLLEQWNKDEGGLVALQLGGELQLAMGSSMMEIPPAPKDWEDTACLVEQLEAVITVDTAMAHLAGAMGIPTLLLLNHPCDWRWGDSAASTVDWYGSLKILRCDHFNDWSTVISRVPEEVRKLKKF